MIGIVCSRADEASEHVVEHLLELGAFEECTDGARADAEGGGTYYRSSAFELRTFEDLHLDLDGVAAAFDDPDYVVFASRHSGDTGALLSAHVTGNVGPAEYGGADHSLAAAPPNALAAVLDALAEHAPAGYDVGLEATHHGPSDVGAPSMFVELGSGPEQWTDPDGARAVARAILDLADVPAHAPAERVASEHASPEHEPPEHAPPADSSSGRARPATRRHLVGIGGGHYAPRFTRIVRETDWAVGHVAADWSLAELPDEPTRRDVLAQAFEESAASHAVVDGDRPELVATVEDLGYRVVGETWVRETDGVPLALVERAEERLVPVAEGLRFGAPARERGSDAITADGPAADSDADDGDADTAAGIILDTDVADTDADTGTTDTGVTDSADIDTDAAATDADPTGTTATRGSLALVAIDLPADLLARAQGIDREAVLDALDAHCVAYETEEGGTRAGDCALVAADGVYDLTIDDAYDRDEAGRDARYETSAGDDLGAVTTHADAGTTDANDGPSDADAGTTDANDGPSDADDGPDDDTASATTDAADSLPAALRDALVDVLRERYDEVRVEGGRIVAEEVAFDPDLAREAGVPEGPAFGRLSNGEAVDVDGRTVEPADVQRERRDVFEL